MTKILDGSEPKAGDIINALSNLENEDTGVSEAIACAAMELDWSDVSDSVREKTEAEAVTLMYSSPSLYSLLNEVEKQSRLRRPIKKALWLAIGEALRKIDGKYR